MTASLVTKFGVGDKVFSAWTTITQKKRPCPDCQDTLKWDAISPAGKQYQFPCPRCSASYHSNDDISLQYSTHVPSVQELTIGSVRVDTNDEHPVSYMCRETGVGSGSIHDEETLFATHDEATAAAEIMAKVRDQSSGWIAKLYARSLSVCDYQIENAELKAARDLRIRHSVKLEILFGDLRYAETIEDMKKILDGFSLRDDQ